jgi:N-acetylglucosamine-6-sulfatase
LQAKVKYVFAVRSICPASKGKYSSIKATTADCQVPQITTVQINNDQSALIKWKTECAALYNQIRFRPVANTEWTYIFKGAVQSALLTGLTANTSYVFQVAACSDTTNHWSANDTFMIPPFPNIILIMLDDARFDSYSSNNGPSFFQSTSIDRIANEGVNFKNAFATYALCAPSRATIFTGLYPHKNGCYNNQTSYKEGLPTIGTILHDKGYYTAMIGKFLFPSLPNDPEPGWDLWMAQDKWAKINPRYNHNGVQIKPKGHEMDIVTDTAIHIFATHTDQQPLLMMVNYLSPHVEYVPKEEDDGAFSNEVMPFPPNFYGYQDNYPSFYNTLTGSTYTNADTLNADLEAYFEVMLGLDKDIGRLLDTIEALGKLDNTLIMFVSDNGYFFGEHLLKGKKLAHEPSIRVPLYARYPKWFSPGSINTNQLVTNLDIAPTILAAAGIANTYGMDGFSLYDLYTGAKKRDAFYIEQIQSVIDEYPDFRAVRSKKYKYNYYYCTDPAEEFFDLVNDPQENTNLINELSYQALIEEYRVKLDSFRVLLQDTVPGGYYTCNMVERISSEGEIDEGQIKIYPNPASGNVIFSIDEGKGLVKLSIYSSNGKLMRRETWNAEGGRQQREIDIREWPEGIYLSTIEFDNEVRSRKLSVVH